MNWQLEQAKLDEVEKLHDIVRVCGEQMLQRFGLDPWVPPFPIETMLDYVRKSQVFAVRDEECLVATFSLDDGAFGTRYPEHLFRNPKHKAIYIGKLAVLPQYQSRGVGRWCIEQAERIARCGHYEVLRLDLLTDHTALAQFYTASGFGSKGFFPTVYNGKPCNISLFEKLL
jgi:GNAT superfamily N-acetyltransferase